MLQKEQSYLKYLPPNIGTLARVLEIACEILCPTGAFLAPPTRCQIVPPARPKTNRIIRK